MSHFEVKVYTDDQIHAKHADLCVIYNHRNNLIFGNHISKTYTRIIYMRHKLSPFRYKI